MKIIFNFGNICICYLRVLGWQNKRFTVQKIFRYAVTAYHENILRIVDLEN